MSDIRLDFEWTDPMGARGPELRATWSRLRIQIGHEPVTLLVDRENRSVREAVDLSLYPVAEWLATHWWFLLAEIETPGKAPSDEYERRHNLRFAQEGFALPNLIFQPMGEHVHLQWMPSSRDRQRIDFVSQGSAFVETAELRRVLAEFVSAVVRRLEEMQIRNTLLEQEWATVSNAEPDEAAFCYAAASLGLDPYAVSEEAAQAILTVAAELPASLTREFFAVARAESLTTQAESVLASLRIVETNPADLFFLRDVKADLRVPDLHRLPPWQPGYEFARVFRRTLGLNGTPVVGMEGLEHALQIGEHQFRQAVVQRADEPSLVAAVVGYNEAESPGFAIAARSEGALRFAFCRALFEYLASDPDTPSLVTHAHSERQKRNRAFAAEFLIPADALRRAVPSDVVSEEVVEELAREYQVSSFIIRHQLENHRIARVEQA